MALSNAERQRRHYERQKAKKKGELKKAGAPDVGEIMRTPFYKWFEGQAGGFSDFAQCFDIAGLDAPEIEDDSDPKSATGEIELLFADNSEDSPYANGGGSLARGELMVGCLIDAAAELARIINEYKRKEITDRIHEIETSDLSETDVRKQALTDIVRLKKMLEQLDKQVRWTFPQWKVTGE